ncbi:MAG: stalk domain-containing protein [Defluviitaleaceae bacterium]|nr:stalk domain-containing protein [Defluviitaleaceae bacterium]
MKKTAKILMVFVLFSLTFMTIKVNALEPPLPDSIPVSNRAELDAMRNICRITNRNGNFHLVNDIDLSDGAWTPIQGAASEFDGTFDGQGFVIRNLSVTRGNSNNNAGLFAQTSNNTVIKNLGLENVNIDIKVDSGPTVSVGAIVGLNNGTITNSFVTGTVSGDSTGTDAYAGGIAGSNNGTISDSFSDAAVIVSSRGSASAGGIVGDNSGSIRNSYNTGSVNVRRGMAVGGVVGVNRDAGVILNAFWNSDSLQERIGNQIPLEQKQGIGQGTGDTTGISTTQMQVAFYFTEWNFETVWEHVTGVNNGLPVLRVFRNVPAPVPTPTPRPVLPPAGEHINVVINNKVHVFDVPPQIINGRTMLPLRAIGEALGMTVNFDPATNTAILATPVANITHVIHSNQINVNGTLQTFDVTSTIYEGRTLVPIRMLAEAIDAEVEWDTATRTAIITYSTE